MVVWHGSGNDMASSTLPTSTLRGVASLHLAERHPELPAKTT
jgi:hypothetical protein